MRRILIIEDDLRIAQNISRVLATENFDTEIARDGITGKKYALERKYDLVLLDINLPGINGKEVCRQVRKYKQALPIIMLTAYGEIEDKMDGFAQGVNDYIVKPFDFRELIARIQAALRLTNAEKSDSNHHILRMADLEMDLNTKAVFRDKKSIELTAKEFALLEYFMNHRDQVVSKLDLAKHVWHLNFDPGTNLVEVYINYLRKKIDKGFELKLLQTRPGLGYIFKEN